MIEAVILAAGKGTRMRSECPKVLHEVLSVPILEYALKNTAALGVTKPKVIVGSGAERVRSFLGRRAVAVDQREQKGTGHAVMMAEKALRGFKGDVLILPGDMPLVKPSTLKAFKNEHQKSQADVSVLSCLRGDPAGYGRILRAGGEFYGIREELDATDAERRIQEVNTGVYLFKTDKLFSALREIRPQNKKNEFYLTDAIEILSRKNVRLRAFPLALSEEGQGVNSREDLAVVNHHLIRREIRAHQARGVTFVLPEQTYVEPGVVIGQDTVVYPWCYLESGVRIGNRCKIGPFAKIRRGSVIGDESTVGSFVEVVRSRIGRRVSAKHLTYLGDASVGDGANIGAGTITANFDGKNKFSTRIGKKVLVGSNTVFIAPVTVGEGARTGAGSVVTKGSCIKKGSVVAGVPARALAKKKK